MKAQENNINSPDLQNNDFWEVGINGDTINDRWFDKHYQGEIQPIEVMQANMTNEEFIGFLRGNVIKYALRMGKKDAPLKETYKIIRYATWLAKAQLQEKINPRE